MKSLLTVTYANKRAIELLGANPCGEELNKQPESFRILTLDGEVCLTDKLYS